MRTAALFACLGLSLLACRSDDPKKTGDDDTKMDAPPGGQMHIQDVQGDAVGKGDPVALSGVIVTAIDVYGMKVGDIWIEEPGGGPFSGVHVFGVSTDTVSSLQLGDVIDVTGAVKDEFVFNPGPGETGSVTEIKPATSGSLVVTVTGHGEVPTPDVVDAQAIGMMTDQTARDAEWEKWEGVLIKVSNVAATSGLHADAAKPDQDTVTITGGIQLESGLASLGTPNANDCFASVTGVLDWFYEYNLYPRTTGEIVGGGTGCPVSPNATIPAIQAGTTTGAVTIPDVFVIAKSFNKKGVWVAQSLTAAPNQGIQVRSSSAFPDAVAVGAKVTVTGTVKEFNFDTTGDPATGDVSLTEIDQGSITVTTPPGSALPVPLAVASAATLDETYESVLVTLTNVKVVSLGATPSFLGQLQQGTTTFASDDDIVRLGMAPRTDAVGDCFASITGIYSYNSFSDGNTYVLLPTATTPGGTCQ